MKSKILISLIIVFSVLSGFKIISHYLDKKEVAKEILEKQDLKTFNLDIIPLYKQKAELIKKYFGTASAQGEMKPILDLITSWDAKSKQDIRDIVEIAGFLDQRLSNSIEQLDPTKKSQLIKDLEPIERKIRNIDSQFHTVQVPPQVTK